MFCYNCGCHLSEHDFCTSCGADVSLYKKIMCMSNRFYNDGLEKAGVRDLTGAINSLRQSLKFNKNNIEARNLLGLVYFIVFLMLYVLLILYASLQIMPAALSALSPVPSSARILPAFPSPLQSSLREPWTGIFRWTAFP